MPTNACAETPLHTTLTFLQVGDRLSQPFFLCCICCDYSLRNFCTWWTVVNPLHSFGRCIFGMVLRLHILNQIMLTKKSQNESEKSKLIFLYLRVAIRCAEVFRKDKRGLSLAWQLKMCKNWNLHCSHTCWWFREKMDFSQNRPDKSYISKWVFGHSGYALQRGRHNFLTSGRFAKTLDFEHTLWVW